MTPPNGHPLGEEIQELLDARLTAARRTEVEAHLAGCAECRRELETLRLAKAAARYLPVADPPPALSARVAAALAGEGGRTIPVPFLRLRRAALGAGLAAAAVLALLLVGRGGRDRVRAVARDFAAYQAGTLALDTATAEAPALERYFARHGITFPTRVFDLGMMGYGLAGGRVHRADGRRSALFAYRGASARALVCQMYQGTLDELPAGTEVREHNGIRFRIYRANGVTLVFWQEGAVVCVLVSDAPPEEVVLLAYAKAVKV